MQKLRIFSFLLLFLAPFALSAQVHETPESLIHAGKHRYGIESGSVKYEFRGKASGFELIRFDNYGWQEVRRTEKVTSTFGMTNSQKVLSILRGNRQAFHNLGSQYASVSNERFLTGALSESSPAMEVLFGEEVIKRKKAKMVGTEVILGQRCKVYEVAYENSKVWVWEGIVLKSVQKILDEEVVMEATQLDLDWEPTPAAFALPEGLTVQGMEW